MRILLLILAFGITVETPPPPPVVHASPQQVGSFSMVYPSGWSAAYLTDGQGRPIETIVEIKGAAGYKRTVWAEAHDILSFGDGIAILKRYCDADGGYSSYRCPTGKVVRTFTTPTGLKAAEVMMVLERQVELKIERKRFRAFVVHDGRHRGLLIHAVYTEGVTRGNGDIRRIAEKILSELSVDAD